MVLGRIRGNSASVGAGSQGQPAARFRQTGRAKPIDGAAIIFKQVQEPAPVPRGECRCRPVEAERSGKAVALASE